MCFFVSLREGVRSEHLGFPAGHGGGADPRDGDDVVGGMEPAEIHCSLGG